MHCRCSLNEIEHDLAAHACVSLAMLAVVMRAASAAIVSAVCGGTKAIAGAVVLCISSSYNISNSSSIVMLTMSDMEITSTTV
jgi:hypothetical protein